MEGMAIVQASGPKGLRRLEPGQNVLLRPGSPIYRGPYESTVLGEEEAGIRVAVPMEQGKLILLPVGTPVVLEALTVEGERHFRTRVCERRTGSARYLVLETLAEDPKIGSEELQVPVWAVTSGKGGVGKTTAVVNLAIALSDLGRRVCIIDGDLGTANIDVVLNLAPHYTLTDVISGRRHILEVLVEGPRGVIVLPGGSGLQELTELDEESFANLIRQFRVLERYTDLILIDTASGLSRSVTNFIVAANEAVLITTPEPPAITDAYALVKVLSRAGYVLPIKLVVNRVQSPQEGIDVADKMVFAARRFLQYELQALGYISEDEHVGRAVREQVAVVLQYPRAQASQDFREIASRLLGLEHQRPVPEEEGGARGFLRRLRSLLGSKTERGSG
jgi:flagellar biosynthesis protein FlhG